MEIKEIIKELTILTQLKRIEWYGREKEAIQTALSHFETLQKVKEMGGVKEIDGDTSDGYHTFNELYDHRCLLWIYLCQGNTNKAYLIKEHFKGWFLLGIETFYGQISYHCPNKFLYLTEGIKEKQIKYDGHTSNDVLIRLTQATRSHILGTEKKEE